MEVVEPVGVAWSESAEWHCQSHRSVSLAVTLGRQSRRRMRRGLPRKTPLRAMRFRHRQLNWQAGELGERSPQALLSPLSRLR